jgi:hypothetical protein
VKKCPTRNSLVRRGRPATATKKEKSREMKQPLLPTSLALWAVLAFGSARGQPPDTLPEDPKAPPAQKETLPVAPAPAPAPAAGPACGPGGCAHPERTRAVTEVHLIDRQRATTALELKLREDVTRTPTTGLEIDYPEERRVVPSIELVPRQVDEQVTVHTTKLVEEVDPCTGKCCKVYKQIPEVKTVQVTVYDRVPVERIYVVRTPVAKQVPMDLVVRRFGLEANTVPAIEKRLEGVFLKHDVAVPPAAPLPPLPCVEVPPAPPPPPLPCPEPPPPSAPCLTKLR